MKNLKKSFLILFGVTLLGFGLTACGHHNMGPEEKADWMVKKINKELELNDVQLAKLNTFKGKILQTHNDMHATKQQRHEQILELVQAPVLDQAQILGMLQKHTDDLNQSAPELVSALADVMDSLSVEQKEKLAQHLKEKKDHWSRHHRY